MGVKCTETKFSKCNISQGFIITPIMVVVKTASPLYRSIAYCPVLRLGNFHVKKVFVLSESSVSVFIWPMCHITLKVQIGEPAHNCKQNTHLLKFTHNAYWSSLTHITYWSSLITLTEVHSQPRYSILWYVYYETWYYIIHEQHPLQHTCIWITFLYCIIVIHIHFDMIFSAILGFPCSLIHLMT